MFVKDCSDLIKRISKQIMKINSKLTKYWNIKLKKIYKKLMLNNKF